MNEFEIEFDNLPVYYRPGQNVKGQVSFNAHQDEEKVTGPTIRCIGKASVEWNESRVGRGINIFLKEEVYLDQAVPIDQKGAQDQDQSRSQIHIVRRGLHTYPFTIKLPEGIPSSFDSEYGSIKYYCEATIRVKPKKREEFNLVTARKEFPVNDMLDLNNYFEAFQSVQIRKEKAIWCFICQSGNGPVGFKCELPKTGFLAGEPIPNLTELFNYTGRNAAKMHITLFRETIFHMELNQHVILTKLGELCLDGVKPGETETLDTPWEIIPRTPPVNLLGCKIITTKHYLKLKMDISMRVNLRAKIPIVIGMVPRHGDGFSEEFVDYYSTTSTMKSVA